MGEKKENLRWRHANVEVNWKKNNNNKNLVTLWVGCGTNRCVGLKTENEWYWDRLFWPRSRLDDWRLLFCKVQHVNSPRSAPHVQHEFCFPHPTNHIAWFMASLTLPSLLCRLPALFCYSLPLVSTLPRETVMSESCALCQNVLTWRGISRL